MQKTRKTKQKTDKNLPSDIPAGNAGYFRFKELDGKYLLTNDVGHYIFLSRTDFGKFISGKIPADSEKGKALAENGFINIPGDVSVHGDKNPEPDFMLNAMASQWLSKKNFLLHAPSLHIIVLTRRCNLACIYCHANAGMQGGTDMTKATARKVLDTIFSCPSRGITIELQGGEPTLNWPVLTYIVTEARERAVKTGKNVVLSLVSNLSTLTDDKVEFLRLNKVSVCTSLDGHRALHSKNRPFALNSEKSSYDYAVKGIKALRKAFAEEKYSGDALLTVTKNSLGKAKQIINDYKRLKMESIFIRFLNPYGSAKEKWEETGYSPEEFLKFYKEALSYIIELNLSGEYSIVEHTARILLCKIFRKTDPGYVDLRSPCGAAIGQIAYNYDGSVYTCDEGRMLAAMGDETFCIGKAGKDDYNKLISSPVAKCVVTASLADLQPACSSCVYQPYCGVCPVLNYSEHGDLFMHGMNYRCRIYSGIFDYLFTLMKDKKILKLFREWAVRK